MSGANVSQTEAIERFRAAVIEFADQARDGLDQLDREVQRVLDWLEHDRPPYWKQQVRAAQDDVHRAKLDLERCLTFRVSDEAPSCHEERAHLHQTQMRLAYCREKVEVAASWRRQLHVEHFEYRGRVGQLAGALEQDVPQAVAALTRVLDRLEAYRATRSGPGPAKPAPGTEYNEHQ